MAAASVSAVGEVMRTERRRRTTSPESERRREGSQVIQASDQQHRGQKRRRVHIASFNPLTTNNGETLLPLMLYRQASAWLAWYHLNHKTHILPGLRERFEDSCPDMDFGLEMIDTELSQIHSARQLWSRTTTGEVVGLVGAARSTVSGTISSLASAYNLPQVSSMSTSSELDNKERHPLFARTVPTNHGDSIAFIRYFRHLGVTDFAILHVADGFGNSFAADLIRESARYNLHVTQFSFTRDKPAAHEQAMSQLKKSGRRYIIGIYGSATWPEGVALAAKHGIMGVPGYQWFFTEGSSKFLSTSFALNVTAGEGHLAKALHGTGWLVIHPEPHAEFIRELEEFSQSPELQEQFKSQIADLELMPELEIPAYFPSHYDYMTYDAYMVLALAACEYPQDFFTGQELYQQLLSTSFQGVSGRVSFDNTTGTRRADELQFRIANMLISTERSAKETELIYFDSATSVLVDLRTDSVEEPVPFVYTDSTTVPPPTYPPLEHDLNLIPTAVIGFGLGIASFVMLLSLIWGVWTWRKHNKDVVRVAQPTFLYQLCCGAFIAAASVIPMSLQEPVSKRGLDAGCMIVPWLSMIGFVTALSALFSKTWRLNMVFGNSASMRKVVVRPKHVILPFLCLMTVTVGLLTAWTIVAPLRWLRLPVKGNLDSFGRSKESYGVCVSESNALFIAFCVPLVGVNLLALVVANYQAFKARNIDTAFSSAFYIGLANFGLLETVIIGIPLLFILDENPTSFYLVRCCLICVGTLAILLPIFLPIFLHQRDLEYSDNSRPFSRSHSVHTTATVRRLQGQQPSMPMSGSIRGSMTGSLMNLLPESSFVNGSLTVPDDEIRFEPGVTRIHRAPAYFGQQKREAARNNRYEMEITFEPESI